MADMRSWSSSAGGRWRFFPLPTQSPSQTQTQSHPLVEKDTGIQQRPSAYGPPSQSSVMRLALAAATDTPQRAPGCPNGRDDVILPACLKTTEQVASDTDYWLRACAVWGITRGPRSSIALSPFLPRAGVSRFRSEALLSWPCDAQICEQRKMLPPSKVDVEFATFLGDVSHSNAPGPVLTE